MAVKDRFYRIVVEALAQDRLTLPTLPEVAMRLRELLRDEDVGSARVAEEVNRDPAIAVRLIRVANSAALRTGRNVDNVQQAVTRLGLRYTRLLVDGLAQEQMYRARDPDLKARLRRCWQDSLAAAAYARVLAAHCTMLNPEMAMLGGLVHQVGVLPILGLADGQPPALSTAEQVDDAVTRLSPRIGRMVLQAWHFPAELVDVPALWPDFGRSHEGAPDYVDVVSAAVLATRGSTDPQLAAVDTGAMPALRKLDLEPDFATSDDDGPLATAYRSSLELLQAA